MLAIQAVDSRAGRSFQDPHSQRSWHTDLGASEYLFGPFLGNKKRSRNKRTRKHFSMPPCPKCWAKDAAQWSPRDDFNCRALMQKAKRAGVLDTLYSHVLTDFDPWN